MRIVVLDGYTENPGDLSWEGFEELGELTVYDRTPFDDTKEIIKRIGDAGIVITNKTPLPRAVFEACTGINYVGMLTTGYNVVDCLAAKERGIPVCNIPSYGTAAVGQDGAWERSTDWCFWDYPLIELAGKTMGIIGYGRIGQATGRIARGLGMKVLAYDSHQDLALTGPEVRYAKLEELYAESDVIALHCPLFPETLGMINRDSIAKMKDGVIILNNSRGPLIVEEDLAEALNSGKVYAAGLDVVSEEPIRGDNPLLSAPNCIITPHISWTPIESRRRLMDIAVENVRSFLAGRPQNVVNP